MRGSLCLLERACVFASVCLCIFFNQYTLLSFHTTSYTHTYTVSTKDSDTFLKRVRTNIIEISLYISTTYKYRYFPFSVYIYMCVFLKHIYTCMCACMYVSLRICVSTCASAFACFSECARLSTHVCASLFWRAGILPYILHRVTIAEVRFESCNNSCCTTTSILHATLDIFWDSGFAVKPVFSCET